MGQLLSISSNENDTRALALISERQIDGAKLQISGVTIARVLCVSSAATPDHSAVTRLAPCYVCFLAVVFRRAAAVIPRDIASNLGGHGCGGMFPINNS